MTDAALLRRTFSVAIFARHEGRVLLVRHRRLGCWLPVGGELEPGETPLEAAVRELREETGLEGRFSAMAEGLEGEPPGLLGYEEHAAGVKGTHLNFCFAADVASDRLIPNAEFGEWRWITAPVADLDCPPNVRQLVVRALSGRPAPLAAVGHGWIERFNRRDLDALLSLYAADAVHVSPKLRAERPETLGRIEGVPALRAWWEGCFARLPGLRYLPRSVTADSERVFVEYLRECPGAAPLEVAELFRCRGGLIVQSTVFHG